MFAYFRKFFKKLLPQFKCNRFNIFRFPQIKQFNIEGFDEMSRYGVGRKTTEMWFYIMPDGLTQEVTINALDTKDLKNNKPRPFSLVLSPFSAIFKYYDTFQA